MGARALQKRLIRRIRRVQRDHVCDRQPIFVAPDPLDSVPGAYVAFSLNGEIESAAAALQETLDHFGLPETDRQLVAGHAGLCDNEFRNTDAVAVANPNVVLQ